MATCKDCLHVEVCKFKDLPAPLSDSYIRESECIEKRCGNFKDRSRFVELPCKVGDIVYCLTLPEKRMVTRIIVTRYGLRITVNDMFSFDMSQIGKTIFLTKEQAEQALKERENEVSN